MLRKFVCAAVVVVLGFSLAMADEFGASISKVDGKNVTFTKQVKKGEPKGDAITLPVADDVKVVKGKYNKEEKKVEVGDAITDGLKNAMFTTISDKGVFARITTSDDGKTITQITVTGGKKKKAE
jgi:hypothetical protein